MDAQSLFREGVLALRDKHDIAQARQLLNQSLKLDPNNEMAWLWLSRTTDDPQKKLLCVERALRINPQNEQALTLRQKLRAATAPEAESAPPAARAAGASPAYTPTEHVPAFFGQMMTEDVEDEADEPDEVDEPDEPEEAEAEAKPRPLTPPTARQQKQIDGLLAEADRLVQAGDNEGAIEQWVHVLEIQVDHPTAIQNAVRALYKLGYKDDAYELITRAIDAGTTSISIHMTGIDLARLQGEQGRSDDLREKVALLPGADDELIVKMVDYFVELAQTHRAIDLLGKALESHPSSQTLLLKMGDLQEYSLGRRKEAALYYERAARVKGGSKGGRAADKALSNFTPIITDRERGSIGLAAREGVGFGIVFLLMGWQDAGLNLLNMGAARWLGVGLSILGGYFLVTGLSAPQQKPLASWFGGKVPEPLPAPPTPKPGYQFDETPLVSGPIQEATHLPILPDFMRAVFAALGLALLIGAFVLVFSVSLQLLRHPVPTHIPKISDLIQEK